MRWLSSFFRDGLAPNDKLPGFAPAMGSFLAKLDERRPDRDQSMHTVDGGIKKEARLNVRLLGTSPDGEIVLLLKRERRTRMS